MVAHDDPSSQEAEEEAVEFEGSLFYIISPRSFWAT